ncbi:pyrroline-5-carboxylate reductase [Neoasaia chiangmaiensis]|uniref:Pyrroline-5-carboxylate reductase n=1 Tax=Neoasaia chiangmaiensis TaxID=320497 RepID=A0A1U9KQU1_9PROT|nr:pyrroline-5-carboxylate reductase [Neoasaia chiangmaiensis]AQS88092.1 pyrroline-5-carboxylate reductase [Neoasaia chiangmaiensis]GEN15779.1 pyrroline-5-carboxylate reductase [Neoasaia chiangmaiensis]
MTDPVLPRVLLVGRGKMGGALWSGWLRKGLAPSVVLDRHGTAVPAPHRVAKTPADIPQDFQPDFIILAVKPVAAADAIAAIAPWLPGAVLISVMAGRTVAGLRDIAGRSGCRPPVLRAMPNTPAEIGQGITGAYASDDVSPARRAQAEALLSAVGAVAWVTDEAQIDIVTAISGSGPAYVFLLAELLEKTGLAHGLPAQTARLLARGTVSGAGALLAVSPEESDTLRRNVTSPNGTTAAALSVLMTSEAWPKTIDQAISAAAARARELAQ